MENGSQKKITAFFSRVPVKRGPQHNLGVSPDNKRVSSTSTTTAGTSDWKENLQPCTKNLSGKLGSRAPSKLSLGRGRGGGRKTSGSTLKLGRGKLTRQKEEVIGLTNSCAEEKTVDKVLDKVEEDKDGRFSASTVDAHNKYNSSKSVKSVKLGNVEIKKSQGKGRNFCDSFDKDESNNISKSNEVKKGCLVDSSPQSRNKSAVGKSGRGKAKGKSTSSDSGKPNKKNVEEEELSFSDLFEDLPDTPQTDKVKLNAGSSLDRPGKKRVEARTTDDTDSSDSDSVSVIFGCTQAFQAEENDETDGDSLGTPRNCTLSKLPVSPDEKSMELFPEETEALQKRKSLENALEAKRKIFEDSLKTQLTQVTQNGFNDSDGARHDIEAMPGTLRTKVSENGTPGFLEIDWGDSPPGTPEVNGFHEPLQEVKCDGASKGEVVVGGTAEATMDDDDNPAEVKINGDGTHEIMSDGTLGTSNVDVTPRTPENKGGKGAAAGKLSRQEEMDCRNILDLFEDMSPFKQEPSESKTVPRLFKDDA